MKEIKYTQNCENLYIYLICKVVYKTLAMEEGENMEDFIVKLFENFYVYFFLALLTIKTFQQIILKINIIRVVVFLTFLKSMWKIPKYQYLTNLSFEEFRYQHKKIFTH